MLYFVCIAMSFLKNIYKDLGANLDKVSFNLILSIDEQRIIVGNTQMIELKQTVNPVKSNLLQFREIINFCGVLIFGRMHVSDEPRN